MASQGRFLGDSGLTVEGLCETRLTCVFAGVACCAVVVFALALPLTGALAFCLAGGVFMSGLPQRVAKGRIQQRRDDLERELPQMLSMVSLGLRGGLSFDRSFSLYAEGFSTDFASACLNAQRRWEMSLATREDSLRELASSYDSDLLAQAIESMIRCLRLGTALADGLEALAYEARNQYSMRCKEAIAKAPVKMLVPTGALILPAMLILVMGPILLEMMGNF